MEKFFGFGVFVVDHVFNQLFKLVFAHLNGSYRYSLILPPGKIYIYIYNLMEKDAVYDSFFANLDSYITSPGRLEVRIGCEYLLTFRYIQKFWYHSFFAICSIA